MATLFDGVQGSIPETVTATFCATLVDEWVRAGVTHAVIAPGSRSTPMALALLANKCIQVHVHHDERSAAYMALGIGLASGYPALVLTTSGTATVELHAAVVEAHQARVPLICLTADRPPELHHFGAPQTIDQTHLYGRATRWFVDPGPPQLESARSWRALAARSVYEAMSGPAGPVQINLPFRDPLVGKPAQLPEARPRNSPWFGADISALSATPPTLTEIFSRFGMSTNTPGPLGVIVAGATTGGDALDPQAVHSLAANLGWPVLAEPRSGCRTSTQTTVSYSDMLLRDPTFATKNRPEFIIQFGQAPASKFVNEWLVAADAPWVLVDVDGWFFDPARSSSLMVQACPSATAWSWASEASSYSGPGAWLGSWKLANSAADTAIDATLARHSELSEPAVARTLYAALPDEAALVVSSSMPIRDLEWYGAARQGVRVLSNRGANGIDGVTSTAVGVALSGVPTALLIGDVAFLHDTNALIGLAKRQVHLVAVVVDNDGGGIFSFLPQGQQLSESSFETLFGTPHGVDLRTLAKAHGVNATLVDSRDQLRTQLDTAFGEPGVHLVLTRTNREANVALHDEIHTALRLIG